MERRPVPAALVHLERGLFGDGPPLELPLEGAVEFLEGAGARGTVELVGAELLELSRNGTPLERIGVVCESPDRWRATFESVLGALGIPYAFEHPARLGETALGHAFVALLRYAWLGGGRGELFSFLRSPFSGLERRSVDFVEGRLRGRAVVDPARVEEETEKLRGAHIPALAELRAEPDPILAARSLLQTMVRNAWGLETPPVGDDARGDARAYRAAVRTLAELEEFAQLDERGIANEDLDRGARADGRAAGCRCRDRQSRRSRLQPCTDADFRRRVPARARGREPSSPRPAVAALGRRSAARSRRPPRTAERRRARPLSLLYGVYAADSAARSRPRSRQRRRRSA